MLDDGTGARAERLVPLDQPRSPLRVRAVRLRHVLRDGGVAAALVGADMGGDALAAEVDLHRRRRVARPHRVPDQGVWDANGRALSDLSAIGQGPEFIFYATCLQTGSSFRFSREGIFDRKPGRIPRIDITVGTVIAASAAGHAAAPYYSLVESCKGNAVNRLTYLTYILSNARN